MKCTIKNLRKDGFVAVILSWDFSVDPVSEVKVGFQNFGLLDIQGLAVFPRAVRLWWLSKSGFHQTNEFHLYLAS
jgi:hypothetical protein